MGAARAADGARRGERAAPAPHRELARAHRPHLRQRAADGGVAGAAGDPPRRRVSARRPQQLRLRAAAGDGDARPASRASRSASATSSSTCCTRPGTRRDRSACTRSATGCCSPATSCSPAAYGRTDLPGGNDEQMVGIARAPGARDSGSRPRPPGARRRRRRSGGSCPGCDGSRSPVGFSLPAELPSRSSASLGRRPVVSGSGPPMRCEW